MQTGTSNRRSCSISCGGLPPTSSAPPADRPTIWASGSSLLDPAIASNAGDFVIGAGHYYVDGILCELDATWLPISFPDTKTKVQLADLSVDGRPFRPDQYVGLADAIGHEGRAGAGADHRRRLCDRVLTLTDISAFIGGKPKQPRLQRITTFRTQPEGALGTFDKGLSQIYLDVWERLVTYVEDDAIREVALNGPDTSARTKVVWQFGALPSTGAACMTPASSATACSPPIAANSGRACGPGRPTPIPAPSTPTPAIVAMRTSSIASRSIAGAPAAESRPSNGRARTAPSSSPIASASGSTLVLESLGRDDRFGLVEGDWVEIQDDNSVLANRADPLLRVKSIHRGARRVILSGNVPTDFGKDSSKHPLLRRWEQRQGDAAAGGLTLDKRTMPR